MSTDEQIEEQIQEKGLTAPRITMEHITNVIVAVDYHVFQATQLTVCCLTLKNGFNVTGESACASPENFDEAIGMNIAYQNAKEKIWALEGYLLKEKLSMGPILLGADFAENFVGDLDSLKPGPIVQVNKRDE